MKQVKTFVVGPSKGYARFIKGCVFVDKMEDAQVVVFTGGEDINPRLYGCKKHETTWYTDSRDKFEVEAYKRVRPDQLIVGICRGLRNMAHVKGGELSGKLRCQPAAKPERKLFWKVQRLGIETKFLLRRKYVSNIPKSALNKRYSLNYEESGTHRCPG